MPRKTPTASGRSSAAIFCFNEAAARCRGKLAKFVPESPAGDACFNEAAARCRGKRIDGNFLARARSASMRPRPDAAENSNGGT